MTERRPQRHALLVVGQSHVAAIRAAAKTHREAWPAEPRTRVIHTLDAVHGPEFAEGGEGFGAGLQAAIRDQLARHRPRVASVLGGNVHNALALVRHPRPFDFVDADPAPAPARDPAAELVPEALVRAALLERLEPDFRRLRALAAVAGPFVHVQSPPPVRDDAFIRARAEAYFRATPGAPVEPAAPGLRLRMWRLASRLVRAAAEEAGACYLPVPAAVQDADGFLRADLAADPTHGNEAYGAILIAALDALPDR